MMVRPARIVFNFRVLLLIASWGMFGHGSVIFWILVADYFAWLFRYPERACDPNTFRVSEFPDRIYELIPGNTFNFYFGSRMIWKRLRNVPASMNSLGFRGPEIGRKDEQIFRVMVLGDSTAFGEGVEDGEEFIRLLEHQWNENGTFGRRIEMVNLAVGGYNTRQEVAVLRQHLGDLQPDMIWMFIALDDVLPWGSVTIKEDGTLWRTGGSLRRRLRYRLRNFSGIVWWIDTADRYVRLDSYITNLYNPNYPAYQEWKRILRDYADLVEDMERAITFIVPGLWKLDRYPWRTVHERIKNDVEACGLACIDLFPPFEGKEASQLWCHYLDQHHNAAGHRVVADFIAETQGVLRLVRGIEEKRMRRSRAGGEKTS